MNDFSTIRKVAIVESDDTEDRYDRNGLNFLFAWKAAYPHFKITLYTIPDRTSSHMLSLLSLHRDWIELAVHGFTHSSNFECYGWNYEKTTALMNRVIQSSYTRNFKAPGWTITPDLCGYPAGEHDPILEDKQGVYKALHDLDFIVSDRHYNRSRRVKDGKYICVDDQPDLIHFHTWDMPRGSEPNGYRQVQEEVGVPWDENTEFFFISEAWEKGLILPCKE